MARHPKLSVEVLRREARALRRLCAAGDPEAQARVREVLPGAAAGDLPLAEALMVVAREQGVESWPRLILRAETRGMDRAARQARLAQALFQGQGWIAEQLLADTPDLADGVFALHCALYDIAAVRRALARNPALALRASGPRRALLHLAFSKWFQQRPDLEADMIAVAEALVAAGADVNDGYLPEGAHQPLSALYGAIGHGGNMALGQWLLDRGADPDDGESLYHATELGHHAGLKMLLAAGADPRGTNALLRAMDFDDVAAVRLLLAHGAVPDDLRQGESVWGVPALHQAARRGSSPEMVALLLEEGADPGRIHQGIGVYGAAKVFGNRALADALEARGQAVPLSRAERLLARAAEGLESQGAFLNPEALPEVYRGLLRSIVPLPGRLEHVRRLVELGLEYDRADSEGVTPVQVAGWSGLPEVMGYLLTLRPDLGHVNGHGGTLLGTILHGAEHNPDQAGRDYPACLRLALEAGVPLPAGAAAQVVREDMAAGLSDWAEAHPEIAV